MTWIRVAWIVLAAVVVGLGVSVAAWPMYQITSCEIGHLTEDVPTIADCSQQSLWEYFGWPLLVVLAVPVALCLVPAVVPRPWVSWTVVAALLLATGVGFFAAVGSAAPNILSALAGFPTALVFALLLAVVNQVVASKQLTR